VKFSSELSTWHLCLWGTRSACMEAAGQIHSQ